MLLVLLLYFILRFLHVQVYLSTFLSDSFGMSLAMCMSIFVAECCGKEHQGAIQAYASLPLSLL